MVRRANIRTNSDNNQRGGIIATQNWPFTKPLRQNVFVA